MIETVGIKRVHGRPALDRAGVAELTGAALPTVDRWYANRTHYGFPERADDTHWHIDDIQQFWANYQKARGERLSRVDRSGDPSELVDRPTAAKVLGYTDHRALPKELLALADETETLPSGRLRRTWKRATLWQFAEDYIGRQRTGRTTRPSGGRSPIDRSGDPNDLVDPTGAARALGYAHRKHLPAELLERADEQHQLGGGRTRRRWKRRTLWSWADDHQITTSTPD